MRIRGKISVYRNILVILSTEQGSRYKIPQRNPQEACASEKYTKKFVFTKYLISYPQDNFYIKQLYI